MTHHDELSFDVAVIGAGTAGISAYRAAVERGARAVLIEGGIGGTLCAREGCMPSKLLIAAADAAGRALDAPHFGVFTGPPRVDFGQVMHRVRSERDRFVGFVERGVAEIPRADRVHGWARVDGRFDDGALRVVVSGTPDAPERVLRARAVVVATGSSPVRLPFEDDLGELAHHSADVFGWETLPRRIVVFGPGAVGLELGQALARLGAQVEILGLGGLVGPLSDPTVRQVASAALGERIDLDADARDMRVWREVDEVVVRRTVRGVAHERRFDAALITVGRRPARSGLGFESLDLAVDAMKADPSTLQVGDLPLFLAGDAAGDRPLLHEAADEGRIAGRNAAAYPDVQPGHRRSAIGVVFSDPQLAVIGARYADLDPGQIVLGSVDFADQGRSRVMRENYGWLNLYADAASGRLLGAELAHPRAEHLAHLLAWAHQLQLTLGQMLELPFYHPVVEEGLRTALRDAERKLARRAA